MLRELIDCLESATELTLQEICYISVVCCIIGKFVIYPIFKKLFRGLR